MFRLTLRREDSEGDVLKREFIVLGDWNERNEGLRVHLADGQQRY